MIFKPTKMVDMLEIIFGNCDNSDHNMTKEVIIGHPQRRSQSITLNDIPYIYWFSFLAQKSHDIYIVFYRNDKRRYKRC